ncbi:MAG TPA: OmpA family protein [Arenicellales bacterium]|nr:OmpA family protein [Arenicellales bacterium]
MNILTRSILLVMVGLSLTMVGCATSKNMAAAPEPVPETAAAPEPAPTYVIQDVNFDFDESTLKPGARDTLDRVAADLRGQSDVSYEVAGFTDSVGTDAYNQKLSERRAVSVRDYLVSRGVDSEQLSVMGYGETNPIASNANAEGRAQNRRVEVRPLS